MKERILKLVDTCLEIFRRGYVGDTATCSRFPMDIVPPDFTDPFVSRYLAGFAVLALEGDLKARDFFIKRMTLMAETDWGIHNFPTGNGLGDTFCILSVAEAYKAMIRAGLVDEDSQRLIGAWLYHFALMRCNGEIQKVPGFENYHQCNQNVPTAAVYEIADILHKSSVAEIRDLSPEPLWKWADNRMVGWNLTWRSPDDSWLYQAIWTWTAYRHALLRRPELLRSENARRSFSFYKDLYVPGGFGLIFGDSRPGDFIGPMISLLLGARLFNDREQLWLATELFEQAEARGVDTLLPWRSPEMFRIYDLWPHDLKPVRPTNQTSKLFTSPLPGRGWSLGIYNDEIKLKDPRFPNYGCKEYKKSTSWYDDLYQETNPNLYASDKPDKFIFRKGGENGKIFAIADLRAQGTHDHPDALGVSTLFCDDIPWLVESAYLPVVFHRQRWLHNVPLFRRGSLPPEELMTWKSDTWLEVADGDAVMTMHGDVALAKARLRHDAFDYVAFDGELFDVERFFVFVPDKLFLVVDRLIATTDAEVTAGQIWHSTASVSVNGENAIGFSRDGRTFMARFAQSRPMRWNISEHDNQDNDPFYFPNPVRDMLCHGVLHVRKGDVISFAAAFGRSVDEVKLKQDASRTGVSCGKIKLSIDSFDHAELK